MSKTNILLTSILILAWSCSADREPTPPPTVSVTLTPSTANVHINRSIQFAAAVHNSTNSAVTWSITGAGCSGATCGIISSAGLYTAPGNVPNPASVTVKATSVADTSKSASATITVLAAVVVTVTPVDSIVAVGSTKQFTATVQNAIDSSVTWTISGSGCIGAECGTISTTGLYTAPSAVPASPSVSITATSVEDTSISDSATANIFLPVSVEWTWESGSNTVNQAGIYGTRGIANPSNVPGAREKAVSWLDSSGILWLFGGTGLNNTVLTNDLWKYDPATNRWTWVSGSNSADQRGFYGTKGISDSYNVPGARLSAVSWIDSSGNLWLFGGRGYGSTTFGNLNDLWKYNPATNQWTWVSGSDNAYEPGRYGLKGIANPSNVPGGREEAVSWIDSSDSLWLFGGEVLNSDSVFVMLNDLWKYDSATNQWTWLSGSTSPQAGIYGTKGISGRSTVPGARTCAVSWIDSDGNLWLFGGNGLDSTSTAGLINDLWKYDPATNEWTWVSGSRFIDQAGVYGTKGIADPSNVPGARDKAVSWIDSSGDLWLFGGNALTIFGNTMNDLWRYNPLADEWTWVSGSDVIGQSGTYGTKGIADPLNVPGAREGAASWLDSSGNLWLFGGRGYDSTGDINHLNDLWHGIR